MDVTIITILISLGVIISFFNLPGPWLIVLATLVANSNYDVSTGMIILFIALAIFASVADNLLVIWGAKKFGGGKWGMIGAVVGLLVGIFVGNIAGGILGPFFGAFLFEYLIAKKDSNVAFKAGLGTVIGLLGSIAMKVLFTAGMAFALVTVLR